MTENVERTLDWRPNWDERNNLFTVEAMDCFDNGKYEPAVRREKKVWLDQGQEGACTGFGTAHVLASEPLERPDMSNELARAIYLEAQKQDEWAGENYSGSSVNGAMKAAMLKGYISEYRWCKTLLEVRHALSYHGGVVIGVNWYESMFQPDSNGYVHVAGAVRGGHALMLAGYEGDVFFLENSWGQNWGLVGGCMISAADLERLLNERGEFACPTKIPI